MPSNSQIPGARACENFYDERYTRGYMDDWPARKLERVAQLIVQLGLPASGMAIDWGCGNGVFTAVLRDCLPGWRIVGLEISRTAIANARRTVSGCEFYHIDDAAVEPGSTDFMLTHHVLEHVLDVHESLSSMVALMKPAARVLHVLPCGNPGSYEHELCRLRTDGVDSTRGDRFFYEDEGHLRRLTTDQLARIAARCGLDLVESCYSHHEFEAIDWLTGNGMRFVKNLCDPDKAIDLAAARRLRQLRRRLLPMTLIKGIARRRSIWMRPAARIAQCFTSKWAAAAEREWQLMRSQPNGSEMYLVFQKRS